MFVKAQRLRYKQICSIYHLIDDDRPCDNHTIRGKLEWRDKGPENGRIAWPGICGDTKVGCGGKGGQRHDKQCTER